MAARTKHFVSLWAGARCKLGSMKEHIPPPGSVERAFGALCMPLCMPSVSTEGRGEVRPPEGVVTLPQRIPLFPAGPELVARDGRRWFWRREDIEVGFATFHPIPLDIEHASALPPQLRRRDGEAVGWVHRLEFDPDGSLWGRLDWTEQGRYLVRSRAYRYVSPAFLFDGAGRVQQLISVALTNNPALLMPALTCHEVAARSEEVSASMDDAPARSEEVPAPMQEVSAPVSDAPTSMDDPSASMLPVPMCEVPAPAQDASTPASDASASMDDPSASMHDASTPAQDPSAPVSGAPASMDDPSAPAQDPSAPAQDPSAPVSDASAPMQDASALQMASEAGMAWTWGRGDGTASGVPAGAASSSGGEPWQRALVDLRGEMAELRTQQAEQQVSMPAASAPVQDPSAPVHDASASMQEVPALAGDASTPVQDPSALQMTSEAGMALTWSRGAGTASGVPAGDVSSSGGEPWQRALVDLRGEMAELRTQQAEQQVSMSAASAPMHDAPTPVSDVPASMDDPSASMQEVPALVGDAATPVQDASALQMASEAGMALTWGRGAGAASGVPAGAASSSGGEPWQRALVDLRGEMAELRTQQAEQQVETVLRQALAQRQITPASLPYHRAACRLEGGLVRFEQMLASQAPLVQDDLLVGQPSRHLALGGGLNSGLNSELNSGLHGAPGGGLHGAFDGAFDGASLRLTEQQLAICTNLGLVPRAFPQTGPSERV